MSSFFDWLFGRRGGQNGQGSSSSLAKQRLQLAIAADRSEISPETIQRMKDEIIAVIAKYVNIAQDKVVINLEQRQRDNWLVADIPLARLRTGGDPLQDAGQDDA